MKSHIDRELRRSYACSKCDYITVSQESLRGHELKTHLKLEGLNYECSICFERFSVYHHLYRHKLSVHVDEARCKYACSLCNKAWKGVAAFKNHIAVVHAASPSQIPCPVQSCSKICTTTKQLKNHVKIHDDDSKEICPECGLLVANKHNLEKHINRVHKKLRNFACDKCEYKGFFKFNIVEHVRLGMVFITTNNLKTLNCFR